MNAKLTLRMNEDLIHIAKIEADKRGKSVSKMVGEFLGSLTSSSRKPATLPPLTTSLLGVLKQRNLSEASYKQHLKEKYS
jgi:hypothetical protein